MINIPITKEQLADTQYGIVNQFPNRGERKRMAKAFENIHHPLMRGHKPERIQYILLKNGKTKTIYHYAVKK